jgi:Xaa-Pro aminopeptidase
VGAGSAGTFKGTLLVPSTQYHLQKGDLVMIELATMVDGYFSDLTYMGVVGAPSQRQREVYNHLLEAQQAATQEMRPGNHSGARSSNAEGTGKGRTRLRTHYRT